MRKGRPTMSEAFRIEHDIIGEMHIPQDVYYGIHSVRAAENFPITGQRLQRDMIVSIAWIKKACARANLAAGTIRQEVSRAIEQAQTTVESRNFQTRKSVLEYDDVMNKQREIIYGQRKQVLDGMDVKDIIMNMMNGAIANLVHAAFLGSEHLDMASCRDLLRSVEGVYFPKYTVKVDEAQLKTMTQQDFTDLFTAAAADYYAKKEAEITPPVMRELERVILLRVVDEYWMEHIDAMQDLRQGIRLRAYAQTNPVDAYKKESLEMFEEMIDAMKEETVRRLYSVRLRQNEEVKRERVASGMTENVGGDGTVKKRPTKVVKVGRNDLCPCGSGLKWKKCTCKEYHS